VDDSSEESLASLGTPSKLKASCSCMGSSNLAVNLGHSALGKDGSLLMTASFAAVAWALTRQDSGVGERAALRCLQVRVLVIVHALNGLRSMQISR